MCLRFVPTTCNCVTRTKEHDFPDCLPKGDQYSDNPQTTGWHYLIHFERYDKGLGKCPDLTEFHEV